MGKRHTKEAKRSGPAFESVLAVLKDRPNAVVLDDPTGRSIVSFTESPLLTSSEDLQGEIPKPPSFTKSGISEQGQSICFFCGALSFSKSSIIEYMIHILFLRGFEDSPNTI